MMWVKLRGVYHSGHDQQLSWASYAPHLLRSLTVYPYEGKSIPAWQRSLSNAWWHAEIGADLAASAGLSEEAVLYIRTHHQSEGPAAELHQIDEAV